MKKQFFLLVASLVLLTGFFLLPRDRQWARERIITYYQEFPYQIKHLDKETRMADRFEDAYTLSKYIAEKLLRHGGERTALILMPPTSYFKSMGVDYPVPEPAVFYYYTGMNTTGYKYKNAMDATWFVWAQNGSVQVERVPNKNELRNVIDDFQKMEHPK